MNNIEASKKFLPIFDEIYKTGCKTAIFDGDEVTVQKGHNDEIKIAKLNMDGLGDFDRNSGYTKGSTSLKWETVKYDKERSQDLRIDRLDNDEAIADAFAKLGSEFIRTKVIPETDAARIAKLVGVTGVKIVNETLDTGEKVISALRAGTNHMDEKEVADTNRILLITPTGKGLIDDIDSYKSKKVMEKFSTVIEVPQTRMYSKITLNTGVDNYGYAKAADAKDINFIIVEKSAFVTAMEQYIKYFTPDEDQNGDDNVFKYRNNNLYGHVYENKLDGVYVSLEV